MSVRRMILFAVAMAALSVPLSAARAQVSRLDRAALIEGLRQEGLRDLLKHLAETELGDDPILQRQVAISQYLLDYEELIGKGEVSAAADAFSEASNTTTQLIAEHADNEQRPIWQTQLAEQLLFESLSTVYRNAAAFYEFGVPTRAQAEAFETAAVASLELTEEADVTFFKLQTELPKEPDHTAKRIDTGLWDRMINQYYKVRTQYMLARATYYASLLPDNCAYFTNLGANPKVIRQAKTIGAERTRLLALAVERLETLLTTGAAENWNIDSACHSLLGRVLVAQGKPAEGIVELQKATAAGKRDMEDLWAHLALAVAQDRQGDAAAAEAELSQQAAHPMVSSNLLLRLLVVDTAHRLKLEAAQKQPEQERAAAIAQAYEPYVHLLASPSLGDAAAGLREYIYQRWADGVDRNADLGRLPAMVVAAMGASLRTQGQNLMVDADSAEGDKALDLADAAEEQLALAVRVNTDLLKRADLSPHVQASAMFNQAMAQYFFDRNDEARQVKSAETMVDLADRFPDASVGNEAITAAVSGILRPLHSRPARPAGVDDAYQRGVIVLLDKFPTIEATHDQRFYYATTILLPAGEHAAAVAVLAKLPFGHVDYFQAQRERLYAQLALLAQAPDADRPALAQALEQDAESVRDEASRAAKAATDPDAAAVALNSAGHAALLLAELAAQSDKTDQAIRILSTFEQEYLSDDELVREALSKRIGLLARAEQYDHAADEAKLLMQSFPDDAAAVIDSVLSDLDKQIDGLRQNAAEELVDTKRKALEDRATAIAQTAAAMAQMLVDWAQGEGFDDDQMVPYKLLLAKSKRLAGNAAEAIKYLEPLTGRYPDDADVIHETAEALYLLGTDEALTRATGLYTALIDGLPADETGVYPTRYYNAWMRYLQISDKLSQNTADIALTVRQLQLSDPNLGGEPYKSELEKLLARHDR